MKPSRGPESSEGAIGGWVLEGWVTNRRPRGVMIGSERRLWVLCVWALAAVVAMALGGCVSTPFVRESSAWQGQTPIRASYFWGTLQAELPPGVRLERALVAARHEMHRQGHQVTEWSITPQGGRLIAVTPPDAVYSRVHISGRTDSAGGVLFKIHMDPDSEGSTRLILDAVLADLGV